MTFDMTELIDNFLYIASLSKLIYYVFSVPTVTYIQIQHHANKFNVCFILFKQFPGMPFTLKACDNINGIV